VVVEPALVLMDEPLSNLDASLRLSMRTEIRRLHQSLGLTTVYVTHDQEEALSLADRLVVLRDGVVQQIGTPQELYTEPTNAYVAGFMGYRNIFHGTVDGVDLAGGAAGPVTVAIRPEDFVVGGDNGIQVTVEVAEYHGRELAVEGTTKSGRRILFRTTERLAPEDTVTISVPPDRVRVFPGETS
jgi:putative spermidine/putrescine transport system ATP-binding protein